MTASCRVGQHVAVGMAAERGAATRLKDSNSLSGTTHRSGGSQAPTCRAPRCRRPTPVCGATVSLCATVSL